MHVCYANNYLSLRGGTERVMFAEADMLRRRGHTPSFFSRRGPKDVERAYADYYPACVEVNALNAFGKLRHAPKIVYNPTAARAFRRFLHDVRPQIVHAHNIYGGLTTAILDVARHAGVPAVLTVHDYKLVCPSYLALDHGRACSACDGGRFYRCVLKRCHKSDFVASAVYTIEAYMTTWLQKYSTVLRFICPSRFLRQTLLRNGWDAERLTYLPNAIDASTIPPAIGSGEYALYAGRLSAEKGIMTLLRAVEGLDVPLRILGDGPLRREVEDFISTQGLEDQVSLLGHQGGDALSQAYRGAAFCVVPSEWYENAPMAVLEAFAHGKPVVGADIGGIGEMVTPEESGLLFPPGDVEALRNCLLKMWRERGSLGDLGTAARRCVETRFSSEQHIEGLMSIYSAVCG